MASCQFVVGTRTGHKRLNDGTDLFLLFRTHVELFRISSLMFLRRTFQGANGQHRGPIIGAGRAAGRLIHRVSSVRYARALVLVCSCARALRLRLLLLLPHAGSRAHSPAACCCLRAPESADSRGAPAPTPHADSTVTVCAWPPRSRTAAGTTRLHSSSRTTSATATPLNGMDTGQHVTRSVRSSTSRSYRSTAAAAEAAAAAAAAAAPAPAPAAPPPPPAPPPSSSSSSSSE